MNLFALILLSLSALIYACRMIDLSVVAKKGLDKVATPALMGIICAFMLFTNDILAFISAIVFVFFMVAVHFSVFLRLPECNSSTLRKEILKIILVPAVLLLLYSAVSFHFNKTVYDIAKSSYANYGENNPYGHIVSDEDYHRMGYRVWFDNREGVTKEENKMTFPITYLRDGKIKTTYWYSYACYRGEECCGGSWDIPITVTFSLVDGLWCITDCYEPA